MDIIVTGYIFVYCWVHTKYYSSIEFIQNTYYILFMLFKFMTWWFLVLIFLNFSSINIKIYIGWKTKEKTTRYVLYVRTFSQLLIGRKIFSHTHSNIIFISLIWKIIIFHFFVYFLVVAAVVVVICTIQPSS